jgi:hypothetical protein
MASMTVRPDSGLKILANLFFIPQSSELVPFRKKPSVMKICDPGLTGKNHHETSKRRKHEQRKKIYYFVLSNFRVFVVKKRLTTKNHN